MFISTHFILNEDEETPGLWSNNSISALFNYNSKPEVFHYEKNNT